MLGTPSLTGQGHCHGCARPEFLMFPARGQRIEREGLSKIHHSHDRPAIGLQYIRHADRKKPQPIRPAAATRATPPITRYRTCLDSKKPTPGARCRPHNLAGRSGYSSALTQTDDAGRWLIFARMASADWVHTKGLGLALCSAR
jgi:hypothetical protein